jgi:predicted nucleic acid-binding protein
LGFRDSGANEALQEFHRAMAPFEYLSSVVVQELRSGARSPAAGRALERHVLGVYLRVGRLITPSAAAWSRSGDIVAALRRAEGMELSRVSKSFSNDILLALSCREAGWVLITENLADFARIQRFTRFDFEAPWP